MKINWFDEWCYNVNFDLYFKELEIFVEIEMGEVWFIYWKDKFFWGKWGRLKVEGVWFEFWRWCDDGKEWGRRMVKLDC